MAKEKKKVPKQRRRFVDADLRYIIITKPKAKK